MPLFSRPAARVASEGAVIMRRATSDIPTSLHFFWATGINIRDIVTKTTRMKAEEPHESVDMRIFFLCRLDPMLWRVENNDRSLAGGATSQVKQRTPNFRKRSAHFKLDY